MKRSEMVEVITNFIWEDIEGGFGEPDQAGAARLLTHLEKLGMLPPETWVCYEYHEQLQNCWDNE